MRYRIVYHERAEGELDELYENITLRAGLVIAGRHVGGIIDFIDDLKTFPARGTVRESSIPGLRIIGYRRSASIAFAVKDDLVMILGVFHRGQNVTLEDLKERW